MIIKRELYFEEVLAEEFFRVIGGIINFFWDMKNISDLNHFSGNTNVLIDIVIDNLIKNLAIVGTKFENLIDYIKKKKLEK